MIAPTVEGIDLFKIVGRSIPEGVGEERESEMGGK